MVRSTVLLYILLLGAGWVHWFAPSAAAQFEQIWSPATFEPGMELNLFAHWEGTSSRDAVVVELPEDWTLVGAAAIRPSYRRVALEVTPLRRGRFLAASLKPLRGAYELILTVRTQYVTDLWPRTWSVAPAYTVGGQYEAEEGYRETRSLIPEIATASQYVLELASSDRPVEFYPERAAELQYSHTLEFWLRTTRTGTVLLSTWDGTEHRTYPLELVIDGRGRVRYFRNVIGEHVTLVSEQPVADGTWHHVALVCDLESHWTKLYVDGSASDSLYDPSLAQLPHSDTVMLGGRVATDTTGWIGQVDDLRFWTRARSSTDVRAAMWRRLPTDLEGLTALDFETPRGHARHVRRSDALRRVRGGPSSATAVVQLRGTTFDGGVTLSWDAGPWPADQFEVQRSEDGLSFLNLGEISGASLGQSTLTFTDTDVTGNVVYYRLLQMMDTGAKQVVGTIKLGLGETEDERGALLLGNYPNPFNPRTTVSYEVRQAQHIRLSVFDLSGHVIAVLVDRTHEPGTFDAVFDASDYPSGTYFVRLQTQDGFVETNQIVLTK